MSHFGTINHFGQKITYGSAILEENGAARKKAIGYENDQIRSNRGSYKPVYILSIASDSELPLGIFRDR